VQPGIVGVLESVPKENATEVIAELAPVKLKEKVTGPTSQGL